MLRRSTNYRWRSTAAQLTEALTSDQPCQGQDGDWFLLPG